MITPPFLTQFERNGESSVCASDSMALCLSESPVLFSMGEKSALNGSLLLCTCSQVFANYSPNSFTPSHLLTMSLAFLFLSQSVRTHRLPSNGTVVIKNLLEVIEKELLITASDPLCPNIQNQD